MWEGESSRVGASPGARPPVEAAVTAVTQARRFGTEVLTTRSVTGLRADGNTRIITLDDGSEIGCKIILIATGKWFRTLDLPGIEKWNGAGVYYGAAHTEAMYYKDKDVIVLGAANSAGITGTALRKGTAGGVTFPALSLTVK